MRTELAKITSPHIVSSCAVPGKRSSAEVLFWVIGAELREWEKREETSLVGFVCYFSKPQNNRPLMSSRPGRHVDPLEGSQQRRSCTPENANEDSTRGVGGGSSLPVAAPPPPHGTPHKDGARTLMTRYKALINDVVQSLQTPTNLPLIDDYITLTEDALRALRTVKVDSRATLRRLQANALPLVRKEEPPAAPPLSNAANAAAAASGGSGSGGVCDGAAATTTTTSPPPQEKPSHTPSTPPPTPPASLSEKDASGAGEGVAAPAAATTEAKPRSYISALKHRTTVSPLKSRPATGAQRSSTGGSTSASAAAAAVSATATAAAAPTVTSSSPPPSVQAELEKRASERTAEKVVEARDGSALRSEERQRSAEERRRGIVDEKLAKLEEEHERVQLAKQRREAAAEKLRQETKDRHDSATKRAEDTKAQVKEKASRSNTRVDEVVFVAELTQKNRELKLQMKLSEAAAVASQEQRREEQSRHIKERNEAHITAVVERQRDISQQRAERVQQREAQRLESLKRLEEAKRLESEQKHQRAEEREKKFQAQLQVVHAEAEAKKARSEERIQQSAQLREEQREKQKQKLEKKEQKLKEVKERRQTQDESSPAVKPTFQEVLPSLTQQEEDAISQRLARSLATAQRQGKTFLDQYQKESALSAKDLNKSRLRALISRIASSTTATAAAPSAAANASSSTTTTTTTTTTNLTQLRQPLHDFLGAGELNELDHEFVRYFNGYDPVVKALLEARKTHDFATFKLCSDVLHRLLTDPVAGPAHVKSFVRCGQLVPLVVLIHEEIVALKKHNNSIALTSLLSLTSLCVGLIVTEAQSSPKLTGVRDQMMADLDAIGLDKFCFAVASTCVDDEDTASLQYALLILYYQLTFMSRRKSGAASEKAPPAAATESSTATQSSSSGGNSNNNNNNITWVCNAMTSLFTLLQNILTPGGQPLKPQTVLTNSTSCVIFTALRILTTVARWKLDSLQDFLRGGRDAVTPTAAAAGHGSSTAAAPAVPISATPPPTSAASGSSAAIPIGATRTELFHIVMSFFQYVAKHDETLERLPSANPADVQAGEGTPLRSFADALQFGLTIQGAMPRIPLPSICTAEGLPSARSAGAFPSFVRAALHELILFGGYVALSDPATQEIFSWGKEKPLLSLMLASLPVQYFAQARHLLFPTLLSIIHRDDRNKIIVSREMDLSSLVDFLQEEFNALPAKLCAQSQAQHEALDAEAAAPTATSSDAAARPTLSPQAAVAASASTAATALPKKSWAEMDDDDDEDVRIPSPGHPQLTVSGGKAATTNATAASPHVEKPKTLQVLEKERLAKALKTIPPGFAHFRLDRRFPLALWYDALTFLQKPLPPPAPSF